MIRSMTGFGAASTHHDGAHFQVEVRALNNRYFKAQVRLPEELQGLEPELESALAKRLRRGSVVLTVRFADQSPDAAARINTGAIERYLEQVRSIESVGDNRLHLDLAGLLTLPGVIVSDFGEERIEVARTVLLELLSDACDRVYQMRLREGELLEEELYVHCKVVAERLALISERSPVVVELFQQRLRQRMEALLSETGKHAADDDVLKEVAIFAERSDIAEEIARLQGHVTHFREVMQANNDALSGRRLDFLAQEMLREANTIGSKCLDPEVSRHIVDVKGAIDRIKEQVQNVA